VVLYVDGMPESFTGNKSFYILLISSALWSLGIALSWLFLGLYIYDISEDIFTVTLFNFLPQITWIIASLIWGYFGDKFQLRKIPLIIASIGYGIFLIPFWTTQDTLFLLASYVLANFFGGAHIVSINAYITLIRKKKAESVGLNVGANAVGWTIGTFSSGYFLSLGMSPRYLFLAAAIFFILSGIVAMFLKEVKVSVISRSMGIYEYLKLLKNRYIFATVVSAFLQYTGLYIVLSIFVVYFVEGIGGSEVLYGISSAGASILGGIIAYIFGKLADKPEFGRAKIIMFSHIGYLLFITALIFTQDPIIVAILWMLPLFAGIIVGAPALISDHTPEINRSKGMALFDAFQNLGIATGYFLSSVTAWFITTTSIVEIMRTFLNIAIVFSTAAIIIFLIGVSDLHS